MAWRDVRFDISNDNVFPNAPWIVINCSWERSIFSYFNHSCLSIQMMEHYWMHNLLFLTNEEKGYLFSIPITFPTSQKQWGMIERICSHLNWLQRRQIRQTEEAIVTKCHIIDLNRFQMGTVADCVVAIGSLTVSHIIVTIHFRETPSANYHTLQCIQSI